jgi:hypothetical protein
MSWQLEPPPEIADEVEHLGILEFGQLADEVKSWIEDEDYDDIALARGIQAKGYSEEFSWWALKEIRMRIVDHL